MSQQTQDSDSAEFGPNQWLVDALREQWREDPSSVDPSWAEYFSAQGPVSTGSSATATASDTSAASTTTPAGDPAPSAAADEAASTTAPAEDPTPAAPTGDAPSEPAAAPAAAPSPASPAPAPATTSQPPKDTPAVNADPTKDSAPAPAVSTTSDRPAKVPTTTAQIPAVELREPKAVKLRGPAAAVARNMDESLGVPTATSVRDVPVKLLFDNRIVINNHLKRHRAGKVSFTHLIGWAMIEAITEIPDMNNGFELDEKGKPLLLEREDINFGLAIDMPRPDGSRGLVVPSIKAAQRFDFHGFWKAYEEVVKKARAGKLTMDDFAHTTVSLTNPGGIGTVHSIPRLMQGQGVIVGVGAMDYPAQFQGASQATLADLAVSKVTTLTSTYDHRIIQGAASGEFLKRMGDKLLGKDGFYDRVFASLRLPYQPVRWVPDNPFKHTQSERLARVMDLIHAFRVRGHLMADIDPLGYKVRTHPDLDVETYGLTLWDLERTFPTRGLGGKDKATLRDILGVLRDAYCRTIGVEYMHISDPEERAWIQEKMETPRKPFDKAELTHIMDRLNAAEAFETFLQTKFVGQKRFSLEGGEAVIPMLDAVLYGAAHDEVDEVCIGMSHRGRLNVLSNLAGKSYGQIFQEFEGNYGQKLGSGDVKYHLGTEGTYSSPDGKSTKVYLAANPSHLEAVNPVLEGIARAKQDRLERPEEFPVLPVLVHGDAAFAGQGVVTETLNLSELRGYRTGGTIHVVINNQIGFTTLPDSSRSSFYSTDVAKSTQLPIFHVNGDDPEACVRVAEIAFEFRQKFHRDVVIDMLCYRRRGHNEGDDPSMTQPEMYKLIGQKPSTRKLYTEALIERGDLTEEETEGLVRNFQDHLDEAFASTRDSAAAAPAEENVQGLDLPVSQQGTDAVKDADTAVDAGVLERIGQAHSEIPASFTVHPKLLTVLQRRTQMSTQGNVDWAFGELLAFGSLLMQGHRVRLAGQDSRRGTFVQRHSVLIDHENGDTWTPLSYLDDAQARFNVYDSSLSEFAALGFEYGYSVESPNSLVLWEAQFGDFVNGAQTIIDEFISASEQKWGQNSSVVMLLPHGYEGQGPDHSSARIERFLQLCAENNMRVAAPSTPASYFHLLRKQALAEPKKPLIVFTPKSMLRNKAAVSPVEDFTTGTFEPVLPDTTVDPAGVRRVLLTSGKVYWDLVARREKLGATDTAIVRVEQLYPLPSEQLHSVLDSYPEATLTWVQEEPQNQGAWSFMAMNFAVEVGRTLRVVARPASASPATGSNATHKVEQEDLLTRAFEA
ncbi:multifunctional oxoglutarate decarboxylase/oxoglutarate dehydrogenase thiamine pyrophosphate-binding subunit/dihydrolipoyllysine-residue succinyltransferase subunit [Brachybacterium saurashtrense]|uniref:Multifunctional oxoglutarate decarboxylase/oxoglutarate dehydrogenase thiamine pyrophosphate-binding subunit/dihydrolipoyllysine-residue succinyltransferase subunit n=1 Tax=Brachybacterium saurashtrense TaxID=556288 RepID=A0A345YNB3_9MICO|nr:multifunctional oxoglutarate decarboxylase/oxoglutarate dehydrogenase thiamine pyrophosphate-binding subunit/dihydrolipoyllysine-residue succinyltransferase subunit [Brachybacterium saurashtrense]AXK45415.1 multifunctional oxoglutarate decarboxylase/oxoglutarate dehydrogenase thiamine pyrophosphate-binding subunit/dihydrolipoyllysine-residue succinyltransferase subunit [Brachybacterium saurashtrense]RRR21828.1 multifunctional oxoglutarate decarboxylase/oxoglutarate dehydrogenase thiamine pyrop